MVLRNWLESLFRRIHRSRQQQVRLRHQRQEHLLSTIETMETRQLLSATPVISELAASNANGIEDEDGDQSDWIEIYNPTSVTVDLTGWHLTDSASNVSKWTFPATTIEPNGFLVVFASSKNRAVSGRELHTNFSLSADGEYLGLSKPDQSIVSQFGPSFPRQIGDVSYGRTFDENEPISLGHDVQITIPTADSLGTTWTDRTFVPGSEWVNGTNGVGFGHLQPGFQVTYVTTGTSVTDLTIAQSVLSNSILQTSSTTTTTDVINFLNLGHAGNFLNNIPFPTQTIGVGVDNFAVRATAMLNIPTSGLWTFGVNSDDGFELQLERDGVIFNSSYSGLRTSQDSLATFQIPEAGLWNATLVYFQNDGNSGLEFFAAKGENLTFGEDNFELVGDTVNGGIAAYSVMDSGATNANIRTNLETEMLSENASVYLRLPFELTDAATFDQLTLMIQYDDGFVAYINGVEIARRNAPVNLEFNSSAATSREGLTSLAAETIDISAALDLLVSGQNVLAIHGLNYSASDRDFLILPELIASKLNSTSGYFSTPTPGSVNRNPSAGLVSAVTASKGHGFFETAFDLTLSTTTPGAQIRFTLDGSAPTATHGEVYSGPIHISSTSTIRYAAFKDDFLSLRPVSQSYIFLTDVINQSPHGETPAGWPATWGLNIVDYGMDPEVVNSPEYGPKIVDALKAIPTISLTADLEDLFSAETGIYSNGVNRGIEWERETGVELINPDGSEGFTVNAGLRIRGGSSRGTYNPKHALRLIFRGVYGTSNLEYPLFGNEGVDEFDKIDLRTPNNFSWSIDHDPNATFIPETLARDLQGDMGQPYTRSRFYHLYINGQYWGLYETQERVDSDYAASYFGGTENDYDIVKVDSEIHEIESTDGDLVAWRALWEAASEGFETDQAYYAVQGKNPDGSVNPAIKPLVDIDNLAAYMLNIFWTGNEDGPVSGSFINNFAALRPRDGSFGFRFFVHDAEFTMHNLHVDRTGPFNVGAEFELFNPQWLHEQLVVNPNYRQLFGDLAQKSLFNEGVLTPNAVLERLTARANEIEHAVIGESARWGDSLTTAPALTQANWLNAIQGLINDYVPYRTEIVINQLRAKGLLPLVDAVEYILEGSPTFGGPAEQGDELSFNAPNAEYVYYTLDGTDPLLPGGIVSPKARTSRIDGAIVAIHPESTWRFHDSGSELGPNWHTSNFDDFSWTIGTGGFGFGDGDERTILNNTPAHLTNYFRKSFEINDSSTIGALQLELLADDGAVVYLNGHEVARVNLPGGPINSTTPAQNEILSDDEGVFVTLELDPSKLVNGKNVISIEVHQATATEIDTSFDAKLTYRRFKSDPLVLGLSTTIAARTLNNEHWSAIQSATFVVAVPASSSNLTVTELNYNPRGTQPGEPSFGAQEHEFIEFLNTSSNQVSFDDVRITAGLTYSFADGVTLAPGEYGVLVKNLAAFRGRYGDSPKVLGEYGDAGGNFSNSSETITIVDRSNTVIRSFEYRDSGAFPTSPDGGGYTLVAKGNSLNLSMGASWKASEVLDGSPGFAEPSTLTGIKVLSDRSIPEDSTSEVAVVFSPPLDTDLEALVFSATSSNPGLISGCGLQFSGTGATRTLTLTPNTDASGTAIITIQVDNDGHISTQEFTLTVHPSVDDLIVELPLGGGTYELVRSGLDLVLRRLGAETIYRNEYAQIGKLTLQGSSSAETLIVSNGSSYAVPRNGLKFQANGPTTENADRLILLGEVVISTDYTSLDGHNGSIEVTDDETKSFTISYTGLEYVQDTQVALFRSFTFDTTDDLITFSDDGVEANFRSRMTLSGQTTIDFGHTHLSLFGNSGLGNDTITILPMDASFSGSTWFQYDGGEGNDIIHGSSYNEMLIGADGDDVLSGGGGEDHFLGLLGHDVVILNGGITNYNLTALADDRLVGIESFDLRENGSQVLTLNLTEVECLSNETNRLTVRRDLGDDVILGAGWTQITNTEVNAVIYHVFTQGTATVLLEAVDTTAPAVSRVSSTTPDGAYGAGESISVTIEFDDVVYVIGSPELLLETGSTDAQLKFIGGSGTKMLTFEFTIALGDYSDDLDYISQTALVLNGSTIRDAAGNDAILTLPQPGFTNSLSASHALVVDTVPPVFTSLTSFSWPENQTSVATITATDLTGPVTFLITGGEDASHFHITAEGALSFDLSPDFEAPIDLGGNNEYVIILSALDALGNSRTQQISITITDQNDNAPYFTSMSELSVDENTIVVGQVQAGDNDLPSQTLTLSISGGLDASRFSLIGSMLSFESAPDFENPSDVGKNNVYEVEVTADDGQGQRTIQQIRVTILPVNEFQPEFTSQNSFFVGENVTSVGVLTAIDNDRPEVELTFNITDGVDAGRFKITSAGALSFLMPTDFHNPTDLDGNNVYEIEITVTDGQGFSTSQQIEITVLPGASPVFTSPSEFTLVENLNAVGLITATDSDLPAQTITYMVSGGDDAAKFSLTPAGVLTFIVPPDFERPADANANNTYHLEVTASDGTGLSTVQAVIVRVTPINDNAPFFTSQSQFQILENVKEVGRVIANDADLPGDSIVFSISGGTDANRFALTETGYLTFLNTPDFENPTDNNQDHVFELEITANDGQGGVTTQLITVTVLPVNENGPTITSPATFEVAENVVLAGTITATDPDLPVESLFYEISGGVDAALFNIDSQGKLRFIQAPDFEKPADANANNTYHLEVTASDANGNKSIQSITVIVTPVNDSHPIFTSPVSFSLMENRKNIGTVTAVDADLPEQTITYRIQGGIDASRFMIDALGQLSFLIAPDFETPDDSNQDHVYHVQVSADDGSGNTTIQFLTVTITPENDAAPSFTSPTSFIVRENTLLAGLITAEDADLPRQRLAFQITGGADATLFTISDSGELRFLVAPDYENPSDRGINNVYEVEVIVSDSFGLTTLQNISITVAPWNDNAPQFGGQTSFQVVENTTVVGSLVVTDADSPSQILFLSISGGPDAAKFFISSTGIIAFISPPDFDVPGDSDSDNQYRIQVSATDGTMTTSTQVTITVVKGSSPVFTSPATFNVVENQVEVGQVTAVDVDLPPQLVVFTITGGVDAARFSITADGKLRFNAAPDYENPSDENANQSYHLEVTAKDSSGSSTVQNIVVNVTGANDNAPVMTSPNQRTVSENSTIIGSVTAADADRPAQPLSTSITGGADAARFWISDDGILSFRTPPDFESPSDFNFDNVYVVEITVYDGQGLSTTQTMTVTVTPVDDNPLVIISSSTFSVDENTTAVGHVVPSDADVPAETYLFQITGGPDAGKFSISNTGLLTFNAPPDFENPGSAGGSNIFQVQVRVLSPIGTVITQDVSVTVVGVNDHAPAFTSGSSFSLVENTTAIATVTATDADSPFQNITFTLSGGTDAAKFAISPTGELTLLVAPDFEQPGDSDQDNVYHVVVTASDGQGKTSVQELTITVTGSNEFAPVYLSASPTFSLVENSPANTVIGGVSATDADSSTPALTYSIFSGNENGAFGIDPITGQIFVVDATLLDYELTKSFTLTIQVTDNDSLLARTADAVVVVNLTDVTEGPAIANPQPVATYHVGNKRGFISPTSTFTFGDVASPDFSSAVLTVRITKSRGRRDTLAIVSQGDEAGQIRIRQKDIYFGGELIGKYKGGKKRSQPDLVVTFNGKTSKAALESLIERIAFRAVDGAGTSRTIQWQVTNVSGVDSNIATREITVVAR